MEAAPDPQGSVSMHIAINNHYVKEKMMVKKLKQTKEVMIFIAMLDIMFVGSAVDSLSMKSSLIALIPAIMAMAINICCDRMLTYIRERKYYSRVSWERQWEVLSTWREDVSENRRTA